jgi:mono/diheme cytochrome c family protein
MEIPVRNSGAAANERIMGAVLVLLFALGIASHAQAQAAPAAQVSGAEVYGKYCASCHDQVGARIPTHEALTKMSPSRILRTLDFGLMMSSFDIKPGNYMVRLVVRDSEGA